MKVGFLITALVLSGPACPAPGAAAFYLVREPLSGVAAAIQDFSGVPVFVSPEAAARTIDFYSEKPLSSGQALIALGKAVRDSGIRFVSGKAGEPSAVYIGLHPVGPGSSPAARADARRAPGAAQTGLLVFRLQYAVAGEVEALIERLFGSAWTRTDAARPSVAGVEARSNTVYVRADDADGARLAQQVIAQIDRPGEHPANTSLLYLRHADATRVMAALRLLLPRAGEVGAGLTKVEASGGKTLLLTGPAPFRRDLATLAEALDVPATRVGLEIRVSGVPAAGLAADAEAQLLAATSVSIEDSAEARVDLSLPVAQNDRCPLPADARTSRLRLILRPRVIDGGRVRLAVRLEADLAKGEFQSSGAEAFETSVVAAHAEEVVVLGMAQGFAAGLAPTSCAASLPPRRLVLSLRPLLEEMPERRFDPPVPARAGIDEGFVRSVYAVPSPEPIWLPEQEAPRHGNGGREEAADAGGRMAMPVDDTPLRLTMSTELDAQESTASWHGALWASLVAWIGGAASAAPRQEAADAGGEHPPSRESARETPPLLRPSFLRLVDNGVGL